MVLIENEQISARIKPLGAELVSLILKKDGTEFMWVGDPAFWGKVSPVLFPIVGGLKDGYYQYEGKQYFLGRHGFARERVFETEHLTSESVTFLLKEDEASQLIYPFRFEFRIVYWLEGNRMRVSYRISNPDEEKTLWFSVGGHPAFRVPISDSETYEDYFLKFEKAEAFMKWPLDSAGLVRKASVGFYEPGTLLKLEKELFYEDALVFKDLASQSIIIGSDTGRRSMQFAFEGFPFFGIWAAKDADFVCLEPWCGIADAEDHDGELTGKEGINSLDPGGVFERNWTVTLE